MYDIVEAEIGYNSVEMSNTLKITVNILFLVHVSFEYVLSNDVPNG